VLADDASDLSHSLADCTSLETDSHRVIVAFELRLGRRCSNAVPDDKERTILSFLNRGLCLQDQSFNDLKDLFIAVCVAVDETLADIDSHLLQLVNWRCVLCIYVDNDPAQ